MFKITISMKSWQSGQDDKKEVVKCLKRENEENSDGVWTDIYSFPCDNITNISWNILSCSEKVIS